ncbi:hypothetical protein [Georgenia wangjunii]|uniref:hypothetical protein n=1 Tax=Georgenia wangjunii TaxID=3117730 RepID=UPI002F2609CC
MQLGFVTAAWGDHYRGEARYEALVDSAISVWGRQPIEPGWYVGFAGLVAVIAATTFATSRPPPRRRPVLMG